MRKLGLIAAIIASIFALLGANMSAANAQPADAKPAKESKLVKAQPGPTPKGKIAVYSTDATTGDTRFIGFEDPESSSAPPSLALTTRPAAATSSSTRSLAATPPTGSPGPAP